MPHSRRDAGHLGHPCSVRGRGERFVVKPETIPFDCGVSFLFRFSFSSSFSSAPPLPSHPPILSPPPFRRPGRVESGDE